MQKFMWTALVATASTAASWAARRFATLFWAKVYDTDAPPNPDDEQVSWPAALVWASIAGLSAGLARVIGRRGAAAAWKTLTNEPPPGVTTA